MAFKKFKKNGKKYGKKFKKKTYPVANRVRIPSMRVSSFSSFIPSTKVVKLIYKQNIGLQSSSGIIAKNQFKTGSINDPDYTGGGHQPYGHDQLEALYKQYVVLGAKINVSWTQQSTQTVPHRVGCWLDRDLSVGETHMTALAEGAPNRKNFATLTPNTNSKAYTSAYFSLRKFANSDSETTDHRYISEFSSDPSLFEVFNVAVQPIDASTDTVGFIWAEITITYIVRVLQPLQYTQS